MLSLPQTLDSELPQARYLILELAALLDRLDDAARLDRQQPLNDARLQVMRDALAILAAGTGRADRVERILRRYSNPGQM